MAKPEWGTKRECGSCGTRFYDLGRDPVVCPKCATELPATEPVRGERHVEPAVVKPPPEPKPAAESAADEEDEDLVGLEDEDDDEASEKEEFIEDASELGEDEDDMAEVLDGTVEEESER